MVEESQEFFIGDHADSMDLCVEDSYLEEKFLEEPGLFDLIKNEVNWQTMCHKGGPVPRLISIQGELEPDGTFPLYRHPADEQPVLVTWTPTVAFVRQEAERRLGQTFNHALIQYYRNGFDYISEHADKSLDITRGTSVVNVSFGATRTMVLKRKSKQSGESSRKTKRFHLTNGSLFVLGWETNRQCLHAIRQDRRDDAFKSEDELAFGSERISLTFRNVSTFCSPGGILFGQGATLKERPRPEEIAAILQRRSRIEDGQEVSSSEESELIQAFGIENKDENFDWDAVYGRGFDFCPRFQELRNVS